MKYDLIVIGGGPGGYVCAIRAAQLGMKVAIIESRDTLGGTCVNVGCIPSKALLDSSHKFYDATHHFAQHGIQVKQVKLDLKQMMDRKQKIITELTNGLDFLIKKNKIERFVGIGSLGDVQKDDVLVHCHTKEKDLELHSRYCVLATGSETNTLKNIKLSKNIIYSDEAISLEDVPKQLCIIGGGVIGLELGSVWQRLGSEVTVVEALPTLLATLDAPLQSLAQRTLEKQGLQFILGHSLQSATETAKGIKISLKNQATEETKDLTADTLLIAVGRRPYTKSLDLNHLGIEVDQRGFIQVDKQSLQTKFPNVYAIGDVIEGAMLAHRAEEEGVKVAEDIANGTGHVNYRAIPWIIYTWPEIAWVGASEKQLKAEKIPYKVGKAIFKSNGRAKAMGDVDGQIRILASEADDRILGVSIVGPNASELIAEATLAIEFGGSAEDIARSFHAHPTLAEVMKEAAQDVEKRAIHA